MTTSAISVYSVRLGLTSRSIYVATAGAVMIAAVAFIATSTLRNAPYQEWVVVSAVFREKLTFVTPICAGVAAVVLAGLYRRNSTLTGTVSPRAGLKQALRPTAAVALSSCLGYFIGLAPLVLAAFQSATDGTAAPGPIATAVLFLVFCSVLGATCGVAAPLVPAALVAISIAFVSTNIVLWFGERWWAIGPVLGQNPQPGQVENAPVLIHRAVLVIVVTLALLAVLHQIANRRSSRGQKAITVAAAAGVIAIGLVVSVGRYGALYSFEPSPSAICQQSVEGTSVCFHRAHEKDLPAAIAAVNRVESRYPATLNSAGVPSKIIDQSLAYARSSDDLSRMLVVGVSPGSGQVAATNLTYSLSGLARCDLGGQQSPSARLSSDIELWLNGAPLDAIAPDSPLKGLTDRQIAAAIAAEPRSVQTCSAIPARFVATARKARP